MKTYFVDCSVEIGCACKVNANDEKEAIKKIKAEGWGHNHYEVDRSHFEVEADAMEMTECTEKKAKVSGTQKTDSEDGGKK